MTAKIFHPLLALIASATESELARYVEYLKEENRILRARIPGQIHTKSGERPRLLKLGKVQGRAIEELITIVSPATFYHCGRGEKDGLTAKSPKGETCGREQKPTILIHDLDTKLSKEFVAAVCDRGVRTNALQKASPNLNGRCERAIQTIKLECLAKFIVFGKPHQDYLVAEFAAYYNSSRSSMEPDQLTPLGESLDEIDSLKLDQIAVRQHIGGLVSSFERKAA